MAKGRKKVTEPRDKLVAVCLTQAEYVSVSEMCEKTGATVSSIFRAALRRHMADFGLELPQRIDTEQEKRPHSIHAQTSL